MSTLSRTLVPLILSIALALTSCSTNDDGIGISEPSSIKNTNDLDAYLGELVQTTAVPGMAISIVKGNSIVYQKSFGYANIQNQLAYTNETINSIASVSKTFVGAAVAKAIEQGYFTLETEINDILPIDVVNPKQPNGTIKIKHLVTHTSGLLDVPEVYLAYNYHILPEEDIATAGADLLMNEIGIEQRESYSLEEFLSAYFLEDGDLYSLNNFADTPPGSSWSYSNLATGLTGYIIETVTGQSFDDYVKENILQPLQMNSSTYDILEINTDEMAMRYINEDTPLPIYANDSYPEGSMYTTNGDMGKYLLNMVKGIRGESTALFSSDSYNLLFAPLLADGTVPQDFAENHGLFWYSQDGKVLHGGNSFGVSTHMEIDQSGTSGYVLMTNMDAAFNGNLQKYLTVKIKVANAISEFLEAID
ncbi:class A beta-lactamase-related serine hydrolase [Arenibacter aquaticus]|uniref:Class A beta-lactamase-related serine hydrolase n=1 Tax=Arenibacter aquaticus TaxID=2489054 RepID=A0A3S0IN50_9FLAO|nr:serine hydrolase domain-containing protein [Arenibacter aquaticus]RTE53847.1 class A beta-lactamase-related serine hydrolase [Arenibacter aquaticus]